MTDKRRRTQGSHSVPSKSTRSKGFTERRPKKAEIETLEPMRARTVWKRHRKGVSWITESIPTEVFTEVVSYLLPLDLLRLSRTSRAIRSILMSKKSASVWRQALKNHPIPLPDHKQCLSLNEPQFVALVFYQYCQTCLSKTRKTQPYYTMSVRLCEECFQEFTMSATDIINTFFGEHARCSHLAILVPLACPTKREMHEFSRALNSEIVSTRDGIKSLSRSYDLYRRLYPQEEFIRIHEEFRRHDSPQEKQDAYLTRQLRLLHKFAYSMLVWHDKESQRLEVIKNKEKLAWQMSVLRRLHNLGYKYDDLQINYRDNSKLAKQWVKLTQQSRPLTERIWQNLYPKLESIILKNRENVQKRSAR